MKLFLFAVLALSASASQAAAPCKPITVLNCTAKGAPLLSVSQCGSKYSLSQYMNNHLVSETPVKYQAPNPKTPGAPAVYAGTGVSLAVALTTAPLKGGGHQGILKGKIGGAKVDGAYACGPKK